MSQDNVPTSDKDGANWQHMVTFGLGLADGLLEWRSDYESATSGDFYSVKGGQAPRHGTGTVRLADARDPDLPNPSTTCGTPR